uniref:ATP synthase F0 subunit b n=1 Tax=Symbiochloris sp. SG-2018 TaxID=2126034 RepID=A0A976YD90_9CHLO|nr:ATP synthase F0 subunit b [Symbiochloris sp. SG-2018]UVF37882.1 ATP synthase F0 subunit b [Symbiochloris sp. SG-2018]
MNQFIYIILFISLLFANKIVILNEEIIIMLCFFFIVQFALSHQVILGENVIQKMIDDVIELKKVELKKNFVLLQEKTIQPVLKEYTECISSSKEMLLAYEQSFSQSITLPEKQLQMLNNTPKKQLNSLMNQLKNQSDKKSIKLKENFKFFLKGHKSSK